MSDPSVPVVVALLVTDPARTPEALEAVAAQTKPVRATYVVGAAADATSTPTAANILEVVDIADRDVTHVWLLHDDAVPRPDALDALMRESARTDASVAGSKLLDAADHDRLESVGGATDVVGHPYTGLQPDEIDQEQYDVVRDVAFAPGASMLVRRDLLRGLGGPDPLLEPGAAEIDFSQRARLSGGRVIVVPSSEVMHAARCRAQVPSWRRVAGRYRATAKAYRAVTLLWVLPLAIALGLFEAVVRTFAGRPLAIVDEVRAWIWNLVHLPSLVTGRRAVQRLVGDEELFRYQVGGSAGLRMLGSDLAERSRRRAEMTGRPVGQWVDRTATLWQTPGFAASIVLVIAALVAMRAGLLGDLPANGFAMPLLLEPVDALRSVGGWWNLGGFGSSLPLHPSVIPQALAGFLFEPDTARVVVMLLAAGAGSVGAWRLASALDLGGTARFLSAVALVAGPATAASMSAGYPAVLGAAAAIPWLLASLVNDPRTSKLGRLGSWAGLSAGVGVSVWFAPLALVAIPLIVAVCAVAGIVRWRRILPLLVATAVGALWAAPYLLFVSAEALVLGQAPFWDVGVLLGALLAVAALGALLFMDDVHSRLGGAGAALLGFGLVASRLAEAGTSHEVWAAGLLVAAAGLMLLSGGLLGGLGDRSRAMAIRASLGLSVLALVGAIGSAAGPILWSGTYGLPDVDWAERLAFTTARAGTHGPDRILLLGEALPGEHDSVLGTPYRVMVRPGLEEAWIGPGQASDRVLGETLTELYSTSVVRPGDRLAEFGIKWVVVGGVTAFDATFQSVLDVRQLPIPDTTVYENLEPSPVASTRSGVAWSASGLGFEGPTTPEMVLRVSHGDSWNPIDRRDGWGMLLDGSAGRVAPAPPRLIETAAYVAASVVVLSLALGLATRRRP